MDQLHTTLLTADEHGIRWRRLDQPFTVHMGINGGGLTITVPKNFKTDFASTPRWTWTFFPPEEYAEAAVPHDFLCRNRQVSRFMADAIFREIMFKMGAPLWKRVVMYYAVRSAWIARRMVGLA